MLHRILMIDDDLKNIKATKGYFEINGLDVTAIQSYEEALNLLKKEEYALALVDFNMPNSSGDAVARMIHEINPLQQVAIYSCDQTRQAMKDSYRAGAIDFIEKNETPQVILNRVLSYCRKYDEVLRTVRPNRSKSENRKLLESSGMIGESKIMADVAIKIKKLAEAKDISVVIHGESGTGKELTARALHDLSPRSKGPFVPINCAAIPKELIESTLFGHKKGSFTGAVADQDGKFVLAHGGTLFLDEIGDLSLDLQAKLLRVLQERVVEPLGSRSNRKIDVRIICASHKKIDDLVKDNLFREDLMYRIKVAEIQLPPLRERPEDIEPLVAHFTSVFNQKYGFNRHFQYRALDVLKKYSWPGNIRELSSVVEKHLIESDSSVVRPDDLDLKLYEKSDLKLTNQLTLAELDDQQNAAKIELIVQTVELAGSKAEAARRLGIKPTHLQYLLNESKAAKKMDIHKSTTN